MNLLFAALLLPALAAIPQWIDDTGTICDDPQKFNAYLEDRFYKRCKFSLENGVRFEVIGCQSVMASDVGAMIPVGEERKQEFDDALGFHETCELKDGQVTYTGTPLMSRRQKEIENTCNITGYKKFPSSDKSVWFKCSKVRGAAVIEAEACQWKGETSNLFKKYIPINAVRTFDGKTYKCVRDGISAKLISGEFELCDKQNGRVVVDKDVYKLCSIEGNNYRTELLGCVRENNQKGFVGWLQKRLRKDKEYIPLGERALLEDATVVKCVKDADSAKLVSADIEECFNRGDEEFILIDTYYRCVLNGTHYELKIQACVVKFEGPLSILPKSVHFAEKLPLGKTMTITYRGQKHSIKCVEDAGTGVVASGDYSECEGRYNGTEYESNNLYKKCTADEIGIEHIHFTSEVIGCISKITGKKLVINEGISVLTRHEFCEKHGKTAKLLTGEAAKVAMNLKKQPVVQTPADVFSGSNSNGKGSVETFHMPIYRTNKCSEATLDHVFSKMAVVYQCTYEDGIVIAKPIGCSSHVDLYRDDSFLTFGDRKEIGEFLHQTCNAPSQTDVRIEFEHAPSPFAPLKCPRIEVKNAAVTYSCTGTGELDEGCVTRISCPEGLNINTRFGSANERKFVCDGARGWVDEAGAQLSSDPIHACVSDSEMSSRTNACPAIIAASDSTSPLITYDCGGSYELHEGCEAIVKCSEGDVHLYGNVEQKRYLCDGKFNWVDIKSRVPLGNSSIDRCVPAAVYKAYAERPSMDGFYDLISSEQKDLARACYFNGRQIDRNDSVFINDFVFTCAEGKEDRLELQFVGCFSEGAPANVAEKLRSRNIAQCDFSKVTKEAEMVIVRL